MRKGFRVMCVWKQVCATTVFRLVASLHMRRCQGCLCALRVEAFCAFPLCTPFMCERRLKKSIFKQNHSFSFVTNLGNKLGSNYSLRSQFVEQYSTTILSLYGKLWFGSSGKCKFKIFSYIGGGEEGVSCKSKACSYGKKP